jgi:hypothetical protein
MAGREHPNALAIVGKVPEGIEIGQNAGLLSAVSWRCSPPRCSPPVLKPWSGQRQSREDRRPTCLDRSLQSVFERNQRHIPEDLVDAGQARQRVADIAGPGRLEIGLEIGPLDIVRSLDGLPADREIGNAPLDPLIPAFAWSRLERCPVARSSTTRTRNPSASNASTRCEPMKPAPPVRAASSDPRHDRSEDPARSSRKAQIILVTIAACIPGPTHFRHGLRRGYSTWCLAPQNPPRSEIPHPIGAAPAPKATAHASSRDRDGRVRRKPLHYFNFRMSAG